MKGKAKRPKLKFRPTPISRLFKQKYPIQMVGDPYWQRHNNPAKAWINRERAVYACEMERKNWPMAWLPEVYNLAWDDNRKIDFLTSRKWMHYHLALVDAEIFDWHALHAAAERDNATWDYHHENYLEEVS